MTTEQLLAGLGTLLLLMLGVNAWFFRRLILSLDGFKRDVYEALREHGEFIAAVAERHRLEDTGMWVHRRKTDRM